MNTHLSTKRIVLTGLLAALVVAGSAIRITVPVEITGTTSIHLGNILCALSGILLGPWLGGAAAGIGSALYDLTNPYYVSEAWITFLFKGAYGLAAGLVAWRALGKCSYRRAVVATTAGAVAYAVLYLLKSYFYNGLLVGGLAPAAAGHGLQRRGGCGGSAAAGGGHPEGPGEAAPQAAIMEARVQASPVYKAGDAWAFQKPPLCPGATGKGIA